MRVDGLLKTTLMVLWSIAALVFIAWYGYGLAQTSIVQRVNLTSQVGRLENEKNGLIQRLGICQARLQATPAPAKE